MKRIFLAAFTAIICCCTSCETKTESASGMSDKAQKNMAASDAIGKAFETGDISKIDSLVADDFVDHTDQGDKKGKDSLKAMITMMHGMMKDMKMEKVHGMADDDYVMSWNHYSGTSDGAMGMPKGPYSMNAVEVSKFKDGKATEHWSFVNMMEMMKMMPPPDMSHMDNMNKMDSSKMK